MTEKARNFSDFLEHVMLERVITNEGLILNIILVGYTT